MYVCTYHDYMCMCVKTYMYMSQYTVDWKSLEGIKLLLVRKCPAIFSRTFAIIASSNISTPLYYLLAKTSVGKTFAACSETSKGCKSFLPLSITHIQYHVLCWCTHGRELVKAVQNRNVLLESDSKRLSTEVTNLTSQLEAKDKVSNIKY